MNVWWLAASARAGDCSYAELKGRKLLAQGWPNIDDLSAFISALSDNKKLENLIHDMIDYCYPQKSSNVASNPEKDL